MRGNYIFKYCIIFKYLTIGYGCQGPRTSVPYGKGKAAYLAGFRAVQPEGEGIFFFIIDDFFNDGPDKCPLCVVVDIRIVNDIIHCPDFFQKILF